MNDAYIVSGTKGEVMELIDTLAAEERENDQQDLERSLADGEDDEESFTFEDDDGEISGPDRIDENGNASYE